MLLPLSDHHWSVFARIHAAYAAPPRQKRVNKWVFLLVGFVWLVGRFLWRCCDKVDRIEDGLAYLTVVSILIVTIGGLGPLFSFCVTPMFLVLPPHLHLDRFLRVVRPCRAASAAGPPSCRGQEQSGLRVLRCECRRLLLLGWWDQTSSSFIPEYAAMKQRHTSDADFGKRMEEIPPSGAMVYQMPFVAFPEHPPIFAMSDYELLRPYLHTRTLRFSYGAMRGREASRWQEAIRADRCRRPCGHSLSRDSPESISIGPVSSIMPPPLKSNWRGPARR